MPGIRKCRSLFPYGRSANFIAIGAATAAFILAASSTSASAQSGASAPVCLAKTDETGGRMRFVALEEDALLFEAAGFQRFSCPTLTPEIVQGQRDRCNRLRAQNADAQSLIEGLYGLSITDMCRATDAWVAAAATAG